MFRIAAAFTSVCLVVTLCACTKDPRDITCGEYNALSSTDARAKAIDTAQGLTGVGTKFVVPQFDEYCSVASHKSDKLRDLVYSVR